MFRQLSSSLPSNIDIKSQFSLISVNDSPDILLLNYYIGCLIYNSSLDKITKLNFKWPKFKDTTRKSSNVFIDTIAYNKNKKDYDVNNTYFLIVFHKFYYRIIYKILFYSLQKQKIFNF